MLVLSSTKPENIEEDEDLMNAAAELIERKNRGGLAKWRVAKCPDLTGGDGSREEL